MRLQRATESAVFLLLLALCSGQRVAPGVPPQHYQQVPVHQQQQYQQQQHVPQQQQYQQQQQVHAAPGVAPQHYQQQPAVQYQQVPVQQQQQQQFQQPQVQQPQQVHQGQAPQGQAPQPTLAHHSHHQQQVLNAANMEHERAHIQEHMQVPIDTSKMSEAELQFHYFKMHDSDNNNKLDGCELIKSLIHWHVDDNSKPEQKNGTGNKEGTIYTDQSLSEIIDYVLESMDMNKDGYVDYAEYRKSEEGSEKGNKK